MVNSLLEGKPWLRPSFFPASRARLAASEAICWASFSDRGRTQDVSKKGSKIRKDASSTAKWVFNHEQNKGLLQQHKNKVKWKLKQQKWEVHWNEKLLKKYFFWWEKIGNGLVKMSTKDGMDWWTDFSAAIQHSTLSFFQCRYRHIQTWLGRLKHFTPTLLSGSDSATCFFKASPGSAQQNLHQHSNDDTGSPTSTPFPLTFNCPLRWTEKTLNRPSTVY